MRKNSRKKSSSPKKRIAKRITKAFSSHSSSKKITLPKKQIVSAAAVKPAAHSVAAVSSQARTIIVWGVVLVSLFVVLSFLAAKPGTDTSKTFTLREKLSQVASLDLLSPKDETPITLLATGDILPARYVELRMRNTKDYTLPFQNVADFLKSADITFGNLESPLFPGKNVPTDSMTFRADAQATEGLLFAGYDVVSVANNHTMNYQVPGLTSTLQELKKAGILYAGAGKDIDAAHTPAVLEVKGKKIAFYAYNDRTIPPRFHGEATANKPGIAAMDIEAVKNDVKNALTYADMVVVSMHAGIEYRKEPTQFQKEFAHTAIDAGASVVIGHHPHVVQPVEYYGSGVIFYSLGNFVFDQFFSEDVKTGLVAKITFGDDGKPVAELFPVRIENTQPRILEGEERTKTLRSAGLSERYPSDV